MSHPRGIEVETTVAAAPALVYRMFTNSGSLREWLADLALVSPVVGGRHYLGWHDGYQTHGRFTVLEPDERIGFTWLGNGEDYRTTVKVRITPVDDQSRVRIRHQGFPKGKKATRSMMALGAAWETSLENLASVVGEGPDLRITQRPVLGILTGDDVGAGELDGAGPGVQVSGVVEGLGAAAAGLSAGDVIVGFGGVRFKERSDLRMAASSYRAGDQVTVDFFRDGALCKVDMELSRHSSGAFPLDPGDLTALVGDIYRQFHRNLTNALEGISEQEAGARPWEGEWSVKEVMAHIITDELDQHSQIVELVDGVERLYDCEFGGNSDLRIQATVNSYPDVWEMVGDSRRSMAQTVGLLANLPPSFVERKPSYWRLVSGFWDTDRHLTEHLDQIVKAREATKS